MGVLNDPAWSRRRRKRPAPIDVLSVEPGARADFFANLFEDGLGRPVGVPFIVVRGGSPGPVLGLCAAVHGDELNGIRVIHEFLKRADAQTLRGSLVCCPVVNVPAYLRGVRRFPDGSDLNHSFPGRWKGRTAEQYARRFAATFLPPLDYLVDIHTASAGRVNSFYARADLHDPRVRELALALEPDLVLHARGGDGTLRNTARTKQVVAITAEVGNPRVFQQTMVSHAVDGLQNILRLAGMSDGAVNQGNAPIVCGSSEWLHTTTGGLLSTTFELLDHVTKGETIAVVRDPFGHITDEYVAPRDGVVIGMARNPVAVAGTRFCHLGAVGQPVPKPATEAVQ